MELDIIINYTEKDNEAPKNETGWVTDFAKFLDIGNYEKFRQRRRAGDNDLYAVADNNHVRVFKSDFQYSRKILL